MSKRRESFEDQGDETPVPDEGTVREANGEASIREESADAMGPEGDLRISASDGNRDTLCMDDQLEQFVSPGMELPTELVAEQKAVLLRKGDVVADRFRVGKQLGFGGMGAVYQVKDRYLGMEKALKVMLPSLLGSETARQRFRDEVAITQQLAHENIVRIYDLSTDRKRKFYFFTMELIEGKTLNRLIRERAGRLTLDEALDIALQLCHALEYAHEYTIHRDLKPQNIMVRPDGSIKILDFGLAKLMTPGRMTRSSMALGTAYYQAPEQSIHIKELDQRADIYSVGVILYQMLTGDIPVGRVKAPSKLVSTVPTALDKIVLTCIEPEPAERYESATALKEALEKFVKQQKRAQDTRFQERKRPKHDESSTSLSAGARTLLRSFVHDCKGEWTQEQFDDLVRQVRALPECGNVSEKTVEKALDTALRTWRRDVEMKKKLEEYVEKPPTKGRRALFGPLKIGIGIMAFLALCALPLILLFATTDINPPKPEGNETEGAETPAVTWLEGAYAGDTVTVDLGDGVTMDMVWCPKGTFEMGDESGHPDEQPVHEVRITEGFWLGRYEVTQAQWKAVTG
ncbi:MAG: protein kinase, partial [Candidatus Hydrogenedentota bacterium]